MRKRKRKLYIVAVNLVPRYMGTRTECQKIAKDARKEKHAFKPNIYCGKISGFSTN